MEGRGKKKKINSSLKSDTKCDFVESVLVWRKSLSSS